jgi:hypothetical protein
MSCPKCGSNNLWDDDMWWGCKDCSFMSNMVRNNLSPQDVFNRGTQHEWRGTKYLQSDGRPKVYPQQPVVRHVDDDYDD